MFYENTDLIDTSVIQPGDGMEVQSGGNPPPPSDDPFDAPEIDFDLSDGVMTVTGTWGAGDDGSAMGSFSFDSSGLTGLGLGFSEGETTGWVTFDLTGTLNQSFEHDFGNGVTVSVEFSVGSDGSSGLVNVDYFF